jgi:DNA-binding response OmpR family regulator
MRLLLVEDTAPLAETIRRGLEKAGYAVDVLADGLAARAAVTARHDEYDLILLDVMLPGVDGFTLCHEWREAGITLPVLMLTALDETVDKVTGLDLGADDYLVKPFDFEELLARLRTLLRRPVAMLPTTLTAGDLVLDPALREVRCRHEKIDVTAKEFALLEFLMRHAGQTLTRDQIMTNVWDEEFDSFNNVVDVHVANLRKKLGRRDACSVETVRGVGYRVRA